MSASQTSITSAQQFDAKKLLAILRTHAFPSYGLWLLALALCVADALLIAINPRLSFDIRPIMGAFIPLALAPILIWRLSTVVADENPKYVRMMRCGLMIIYLIPALASLGVLNHIVMSYPFPLADQMLNSWDRALGFDWLAYGRMIAYFPTVNFAMDQIYQAMLPALILVGLFAIIIGRSDHATEFLALVMVSAVFCVVLAMFFPCIGAMDLLADPSYKVMFSKDTGNSFVPQLMEIRSTAPVIINPVQLAGLAAFPSFHCSCGVLMIYGSRSTRLGHIIASIFGVLLIASTPIFGGHYLVDLLAGGAVAAGFIVLGRRLQNNYRKA